MHGMHMHGSGTHAFASLGKIPPVAMVHGIALCTPATLLCQQDASCLPGAVWSCEQQLLAPVGLHMVLSGSTVGTLGLYTPCSYV